MPLKVQASVDSASCEMHLPKDMPCFLCGVVVPANTWHRCEKVETESDIRRPRVAPDTVRPPAHLAAESE